MSHLELGDPLAVPEAHLVPLDEELALFVLRRRVLVRRHVIQLVLGDVRLLPAPEQDLLHATTDWLALHTQRHTSSTAATYSTCGCDGQSYYTADELPNESTWTKYTCTTLCFSAGT